MTTDETSNIPSPNPTALTNAAIERAVKAERDYTDGQIQVLIERLRGIDRATVVLNETVNRVPTDLQNGLKNLRELNEERFNSVANQFRERDTRSERESRDNKVAVDAAFAAQKEAAAKQDEANQKAIDKSEKATTETIAKLAELFKTTTDGLDSKIADLKDRQATADLRIAGAEKMKEGGREYRTDLYAAVGFLAVVIGIATAFLAR